MQMGGQRIRQNVQNQTKSIETLSAPAFLGATHRAFAFYLGNPISSIETRSAPAFARCYPRSFTFYLGNPFPRLKLVRLPPSLAATLAALPSISEIPFLDSCFPAFLIESVETCAICGPS